MSSPLGPTIAGCWRRLVLTDLVYKALAFGLLTPLLGVVFRLMITLSGESVLSDTDIALFLVRPLGWLCFIVAGALWLAIKALEQASLLGIICAQTDGEHLGVLGSLRFAYSKATPTIRLTTRIAAWTLLVSAPFLVTAGVVYVSLLTEFDINYYLKERPPEFLVALATGGVLGAVWVVILMRLVTGWFLSLPIVLFEDVRPSPAIRLSHERTAGHRRRLIVWIVIWFLATSLVAALATGTAGLLGRLVVPNVGRSLDLMVLAIGATVLLMFVVNMFVNLLGTISFAGLLFSHYEMTGAGERIASPHVNVADLQQGPNLSITSRRLAIAIAGVLLISIWIGGYAVQSVRLDDDVMIMAHRGSSKAAPENTIAAIRQAIDDGADWVEIDVQETADGEVVLFHDSDFMKLAGVNLKIWDAEFDELRDIDIGSWFSPEFADQRVPTLAEVLDVCKGKVRVNIELKYYGHDQQLERRVADIVDSHEMASEVMAMSLKRDAVKKMKAIRPAWKVGLLMSVSAGRIKNLEGDFLAVNASFADRRLIRDAHQNGKEVYVWTVNDAPTMSVMISRGVDGLLTDRPALARTVLQQRAELSGPERLLLEFASFMGAIPQIEPQ